MKLTEQLTNYLAMLPPHAKERQGGRLLAEAKVEIERLEAENARLREVLSTPAIQRILRLQQCTIDGRSVVV